MYTYGIKKEGGLMKLRDMLLLPVLVAPLVPAAVMGFTGSGWWYLITLVTFYACFGVFEYFSNKTRGTSISEDIARTKPTLFWWIIGTWTFMQTGITLHWWLSR